MQHYELDATTYLGGAQNYFGNEISYETSFNYDDTLIPQGQASGEDALVHLERARTRPVAFAVRSNIHYTPSSSDHCPAEQYAISFQPRDFLHIKEKYNDEWWIGRLVRDDCDVGFVPSPMKLENLRAQQAILFNNLDGEMPLNDDHMGDFCERRGTKSALALGSALLNKDKRRFFKRGQQPSPYDVVPTIRPVILIGPSLKGFEVTDMMQKAIFDFLKERFKDRIIITRVTADISLAKQAEQANPIGGSGTSRRQGLIDRSNNSRLHSALTEVTFEIERVYELARTMQLVVLDCDTINHPEQMAKTSLAPILIYLKVASAKVLQRLIKSRGRGPARQINAQLSASEKLNQLPSDAFDVVLDENQLDEACDHLAEYLESYWHAVHPVVDQPTTNAPVLPDLQEARADANHSQQVSCESDQFGAVPTSDPITSHYHDQPTYSQHAADLANQLEASSQYHAFVPFPPSDLGLDIATDNSYH